MCRTAQTHWPWCLHPMCGVATLVGNFSRSQVSLILSLPPPPTATPDVRCCPGASSLTLHRFLSIFSLTQELLSLCNWMTITQFHRSSLRPPFLVRFMTKKIFLNVVRFSSCHSPSWILFTACLVKVTQLQHLGLVKCEVKLNRKREWLLKVNKMLRTSTLSCWTPCLGAGIFVSLIPQKLVNNVQIRVDMKCVSFFL